MNKSQSIFQYLWNANPILRKWILLSMDLFLVVLSLSFSVSILYLKSFFYSGLENFDFTEILWLYYASFLIHDRILSYANSNLFKNKGLCRTSTLCKIRIYVEIEIMQQLRLYAK